MVLDLEDPRIRANLRRVAGGRIRLTLDYPAEDRYRSAVLAALADLLRPAVRGAPAASGGRDAA